MPNLKKSHRITYLIKILLLLLCLLVPVSLSAEVVNIVVQSRETVEDSINFSNAGPYEIIKGIIYFEVDPENPANEMIIDLKLAPTNSRGKVEFSTEFELHRPIDGIRGNRQLLYFVNNRGTKLAGWHFEQGERRDWLYKQGYSYIWTGWNSDILEIDEKLNIKVPIVLKNGKPVTGEIYAELINYANVPVENLPIVWGQSLGYPPVSVDDPRATLHERQYRWTEAKLIPRDRWAFGKMENGQLKFKPNTLYLKDGFKPGWLYELVYTAKDSKVTGLGLAGIRDVVSFLRYEKKDSDGNPNPLAGLIEHTYAWGHSQSARLLNHFVYQNFNGDEKRRIVFDGMILSCPGAGKGLFNSRFAQPTRHGSHHEDNLFEIDFFPLATVEQKDLLTGRVGDSFSLARKSGFMPKMFFINSSTDYWTRGASLLHTDVDGKRDLEIDPDVRIFMIAGRNHTETTRLGIIGRALLIALNQWVSKGIDPPDSEMPKISDGALVDFKTWKKNYPEIPNVLIPQSYYKPYRLDSGSRWEKEGIADNVPPKIGSQYEALVPQVDRDGNEIAGIRLPEIVVPISTFNGWNSRNPFFSYTIGRNTGSSYPFSRTAKERKENKDPRLSILERYPTKADYIFKVTTVLQNLKQQRLILDEDLVTLLREALEQNFWRITDKPNRIEIDKVIVTPGDIEPGKDGVITVHFNVTRGKIIAVKAVLRTYTSFFHILNDEGKNGDVKAGDNIWSGKITVEKNVKPGKYDFDIYAFDCDWDPIYIKGSIEEGFGTKAAVQIGVK